MLTPAFVALSDAQAKQIEKTSGVNVRMRDVKAWKVDGGGVFVLDEVVGKHEFITYAVGINADGRVAGIEIVDYRESYGYEVRNAEWRARFICQSTAEPPPLAHDVRQHNGAAPSFQHV